MIWIIAITAVSLIVGFIWGWKEDCALFGILTGMLGVMVGGLASLGIVALLTFVTPTAVSSHSWNLDALQDSPSTSGSFFLGTGNIGGNLSVSYYAKVGNGATAFDDPGSVSNDGYNIVRIYQDLPKGGQPYMTQTNWRSAHFWWGCPWHSSNRAEEWDFHVAPGTIISNYSLNAS